MSHCQTALPLWQSFTANATELTRWLEEKEKLLEKLLSSRSMLPSVRVVGEEDGLAQQIKSVQRELNDRSDKLELLTSLEGMYGGLYADNFVVINVTHTSGVAVYSVFSLSFCLFIFLSTSLFS